MRRFEMTLAVLVVAGTLSGCNCVGRSFTVKKNFGIGVAAESELCTVDRETVNLQDDTAFNQVKANIGNVQLQKVVVAIVDPNTTGQSVATKASGKVKFSATSDGAAETTLGTYTDLPIAEGATQDVAFDQAAAKTLTTLVGTSPNTFNVVDEGCNDKVPANYTFQVLLTFYADIKLL